MASDDVIVAIVSFQLAQTASVLFMLGQVKQALSDLRERVRRLEERVNGHRCN